MKGGRGDGKVGGWEEREGGEGRGKGRGGVEGKLYYYSGIWGKGEGEKGEPLVTVGNVISCFSCLPYDK